MNLRNKNIWMLFFSTLVVLPLAARGAVIWGQIDDFQNETTQKWISDLRDVGNPNPPISLADAGPAGVGDSALSLSAHGMPGPGGKLVGFNQSQWAGDYLAAGVSGISLDLNNPGASDIRLRLAFRSSDTWFSTIEPFFLPSGSGWQSASIPIGDGHLLRLSGKLDYAETMSSVEELRILHNNDPAFQGSLITATLLVDNIAAVPEPATGGIWVGLTALAYVAWRHRRWSKRGLVSSLK